MLLLAGLVLFVCLLTVATLLLALWLARALWARLTGQPVAPWAFRVDPRAQWGRFAQRARQDRTSHAGQRNGAKAGDVIDVVPREIKAVEKSTDRGV